MDVASATQFCRLVVQAYNVPPGDLTNRAGQTVTTETQSYTVITTVYANDLATDKNPDRRDDIVSIGFVCQANQAGDVVIAIRGTEGIDEWVHDAEFLLVECPFLSTAGRTEDGFTAMYGSLRIDADPTSPTLVKAIAGLAFPNPVTSVTICGHSLGGALATLLALDVAANSSYGHPSVYTYGSPRTGDSTFAEKFDQLVPASDRVENRLDIVPKLPPPLGYQHVLARYELSPNGTVAPTLECEHSHVTYLHLLTVQSGEKEYPLDTNCLPKPVSPG